MNNSKLIKLLKTFSSKEMKEFLKFTQSPYFYKMKSSHRLLSELKKFHPEFESVSLTKEKIFRKLHPDIKYNEKLMKVYMSELLRLGKEFLKYEHYKNENTGSHKDLLFELKNKKLDGIFESEYKILKEKLKRTKIRSEFYYYDLYRINIIKNSYFSFKSRMHRELNKTSEINSLTLSFFLGIFKRNLIILMNVETYLCETDLQILYKALEFYERCNDKNDLTELYYNLTKLKLEEDEKYFEKAVKLKNIIWSNIAKDDKFYTITIIENFCNKMIRKSDLKYAHFLFGLYKEMMDENKEQDLTATGFRNVIRVAVIVNEFEWAENFILSYNGFLDSEYKSNIINLSRAEIEIARKNYEKVLLHLSGLNKLYPKDKIIMNVLFLMIYFELNYTEEAVSLSDSLVHYLKDNKNLSLSKRNDYREFLNYYDKLFKIKNNPVKPTDLELLKEKITDSHVIRKNWLLEKLSAMLPAARKRTG